MSEIFFAYRDGVGLHSKVLLDSKPILIKDLEAGSYDLYHGEVLINSGLGPNQIPGYLLYYCADLEKLGFEFEGKDIFDIVSKLEIILVKR